MVFTFCGLLNCLLSSWKIKHYTIDSFSKCKPINFVYSFAHQSLIRYLSCVKEMFIGVEFYNAKSEHILCKRKKNYPFILIVIIIFSIVRYLLCTV